MEKKFKKGDKIIVVNDNLCFGIDLIIGEEFEIEEVEPQNQLYYCYPIYIITAPNSEMDLKWHAPESSLAPRPDNIKREEKHFENDGAYDEDDY